MEHQAFKKFYPVHAVYIKDRSPLLFKLTATLVKSFYICCLLCVQIISKMLQHSAHLPDGLGTNIHFGLHVIPQKCRCEIILSVATTMERRHVFSDPLKEHKPHLNSKESFELNHKDFMCIICTQYNNCAHMGLCGDHPVF